MKAIDELREWAGASVDRPRPLPPSAYCSEDVLAREIDRLFHTGWVCVGHVSELAEVGDHFTFDLCGRSVLVARAESMGIRAHANVCLHRGCELVEGSGRSRRFACRYHSWTFDLDGALRGAPHMDPDDVAGVALHEYAVETWEGLIFVSVGPDPEPLELSALTERVGPYGGSEYVVVHRADAEVACNWKVLVENFCESYHLFAVHRETLEPTTPTASIQVRDGGPAFNHHTMDRVSPEYLADPALAKIPAQWRHNSHLICIYPSTAYSIEAQTAIWLSVVPISAGRSRYTAWVALPPRTAHDEPIGAAAVAAFEEFMAEDEVVIEAVQRGLASGVPLAGVLNEWERPNWEFGRHIAGRLLA